MPDFFVIAAEELVLAFRMAGADGRAAYEHTETLDAFREATASGVKILIITQDLSSMIASEIEKWRMKGQFPLVVELPGLSGGTEIGKTVYDALRSTVGLSL
jgi:V/A-type H+-transporting ATPase subunit F